MMDDMTVTQVDVLLTNSGYKLSLHTILLCQAILGWTF